MKKIYKVLRPLYVGPPGSGEIVTTGMVQLNYHTGDILKRKGVVVEVIEKPKRRNYRKSSEPENAPADEPNLEEKEIDNG